MCRWLALPLFAVLVAGVAGCRSCDKVERELAAREQDVQTLKAENTRLDGTNQALERELSAMRGLPGPNGLIEKPSEPYPVRSLVLGRQTGGRAGEASGGDDGLSVIVEPRDGDNQAIKAPGSLVVELYEKPDEGDLKPLWRWMVPPAALRRSWQNGLFSTGYRLDLDFGVWPTTPKLRVVAKFQMINGRLFVADKDVTVRLPSERMRRPLPPAPVPSEEAKPESKKTLLAPSPVKPAPVPPTEEKPAPKETLPPPTPEKPKPDNDSPEKKSPSDETKGPILTRTKGHKPIAELLPPIPLRDE